MSNLWERFEGIVSTGEVNEAKSQFAPLEAGDYQAVLEQLEPAESKNFAPMLKGKFRTVTGNRVIFYNQILQNINNPNMTAVNVAEAVTFVGGLLGEELEFEGLGALENKIGEIPLFGVYTINVSYGQKDYERKFPKLKVINKVSDTVEDFNVDSDPSDDGDMPF